MALCCREDLLEKMINGIEEVKARGAKVLAVALAGNRRILAAADDAIFIPRIDPFFDAVAEIVRCSCWPITPRAKRAAT